MDLGYSSTSAFIEMFKRHTGRTPGAWRTSTVDVMLDDVAVVGAMEVTDRFLTTFNTGDAHGHAQTLAYPHISIASATTRMWEHLDEAAAALEQIVCALRASAQWHHSGWDHRNVIHLGMTKVHLDVQFTRYRQDGSVIGIYPALYVIVEHDGEWLIQCRRASRPVRRPHPAPGTRQLADRSADQRVARQAEDALADLVAGDLRRAAGDRHGPAEDQHLRDRPRRCRRASRRRARRAASARSAARCMCSALISLVTLPSGPGSPPATARSAARRFSTRSVCAFRDVLADRGRGAVGAVGRDRGRCRATSRLEPDARHRRRC